MTSKLIDRIGASRRESARSSSGWLQYLTDAYQAFKFGGMNYLGVEQTYTQKAGESIENSFQGYVQGAYKQNGVVFAVVLARMLLFTEARFQFQRINGGRPGDLFGTPALGILERPWPNGTTGELLGRMEQDASLAGNFYATLDSLGYVRRLRPDWVTIVHGSPNADQADDPTDDIDAQLLGYIYQAGGFASKAKPRFLTPGQVAHYSPIPDPTANYRGISWVTAALKEIAADQSATEHKLNFFEHAATPNLAVTYEPGVPIEKVREFKELLDAENTGVENAYKTLYLGGGVGKLDVIGADMKQLDFKSTQGAGETRICAIGGVPPVIVGLSEGLQAATYSNFGQARRKFADHWARPHWRMAASSLETLVPPPDTSTRLWYDARDIAFLQEDAKDDAEINQTEAATIGGLVNNGFTPASAIAAVQAGDFSKLQHTGLVSVQLYKPGEQPAAPVTPAA